MDDAERATTAEAAARAGGAVAYRAFRTDLNVEEKGGKTDVVTDADRAAQRRTLRVLDTAFPTDAVVAEEEDALKEVPTSGRAWVVDPIDGTNNFSRGGRVWSTSVAAVDDGSPVAAASVMPALDDVYTSDADGTYRNGTRVTVSDRSDPERCTVTPTFWWNFDERDQYAAATRASVERFGDLRRYGSAQCTLAMLADGTLDVTFTNLVANPWDTVAGVHMVRQAGGTVTDLDGERWRHDSKGLVASNGEVHEEALAAAREVAAVRTDG